MDEEEDCLEVSAKFDSVVERYYTKYYMAINQSLVNDLLTKDRKGKEPTKEVVLEESLD